MPKIRALSGPPPDPLPWLPWLMVLGTVGLVFWGTLQPRARRLF